MLRKAVSLALICAVFAAAALSGCSAKPSSKKITFVLDWTPNTNHTGIYAAKDLGYYEAEGLEIEIVQPPEDGALALIAAGKADFGVSFQEEVLIAANADAPLPITAIAALLEHNTSGLMSLKEKGITRFSDLEGKTYGSWQVPVYDEIVMECVRSDGGDPSKVSFVPNMAMDTITGITHDFDTAWVYEGWDKVIADKMGVETNYIPFREINPIFDYYTPVLVANNNALKNDAETVKKFMRATAKGYEYAKNSPSEAAEILIKYAPEIDAETIRASQEFMSGQYFSEKWGYIDDTRWNGFFDWLKQKGIIAENAAEKAFENVAY